MASAARCGADSAVTPPINNQNGAKRQRTTNNKKNNTNRARFSGQRKKPRQSPGERGVGLDKVASLDPEIIRRCQAVLEKHDPLTSGEDKIESGGGTPGDSGTSRVVLASWVLNELQKCLNEERVPEEWVLNIITNWQSEAQWTPPTSWTLKRLQTYLKNGEEPPAWFKCVVTHGMEDLAERFEQVILSQMYLRQRSANLGCSAPSNVETLKHRHAKITRSPHMIQKSTQLSQTVFTLPPHFKNLICWAANPRAYHFFAK